MAPVGDESEVPWPGRSPPSRPLLRVLGFLARPILVHGHDWILDDGLRRCLDATGLDLAGTDRGRSRTMTTTTELLDLEREGWDALSTDGDAATAFYDRVLADDVLMLLPGGMVIDDRSTVVESMERVPPGSPTS